MNLENIQRHMVLHHVRYAQREPIQIHLVLVSVSIARLQIYLVLQRVNTPHAHQARQVMGLNACCAPWASTRPHLAATRARRATRDSQPGRTGRGREKETKVCFRIQKFYQFTKINTLWCKV